MLKSKQKKTFCSTLLEKSERETIDELNDRQKADL